MQYDYLIVGAGLFGSVLAERLATDSNSSVLIIDKRDHIGGNCYSEIDSTTGIETHKYGTHIFHTNNEIVWNYIKKFTEFNSYHHQVLTVHKGKVYQLPINLETINSFYGKNFSPNEARTFISKEAAKAKIESPSNFEEKAISLIGLPLYEAFIKEYTIKQWQFNPKQLPVDIFNRIPVRFNYSEDYFPNSRWQGLPLNGYTNMFKKLLSNRKIDVKLNCDYFLLKKEIPIDSKIIFTGPIDRLFDYKFGFLEWRSLKFSSKIVELDDFQGTSVMNYADKTVDYTRIHEPKHLHPERSYTRGKTLITYEFPTTNNDEPYYPINTERNRELLAIYQDDLKRNKNEIIVGGRLGEYAYYDMDTTIESALSCYKKIISKS